MTESSRRKPAAARTEARFRLRITRGDLIAVGPGKVALLEAIEATGSIAAAARSLGMSPRRAWVLLEEMNAALRAPPLESSKGGAGHGGSRLTPSGRALVEAYRRAEAHAQAACREDLAAIQAMLRR